MYIYSKIVTTLPLDNSWIRPWIPRNLENPAMSLKVLYSGGIYPAVGSTRQGETFRIIHNFLNNPERANV